MARISRDGSPNGSKRLGLTRSFRSGVARRLAHRIVPAHGERGAVDQAVALANRGRVQALVSTLRRVAPILAILVAALIGEARCIDRGASLDLGHRSAISRQITTNAGENASDEEQNQSCETLDRHVRGGLGGQAI